VHSPIGQAAVVVKGSQKNEAAKAFLEYIRSAAGTNVMDKYGFTKPVAGQAKAKVA
jgi:ABC-type molybdate transport system substrate-binding protein